MSTEEECLYEWERLLRLPYGLLLVNSEGVVMQISPIAGEILQNSEEITIRNGEIHAPQRHVQLKKLIQSLAATENRPFLLRFDRQPARNPLFLMGMAAGKTLYPKGNGAILMIGDPEMLLQPNLEVLRAIFGFTPTECAVAELLINGKGPAAVMEELRISSHTARSHIKKLLQKTGTSRQSELVHLLLNCPGLTWPGDVYSCGRLRAVLWEWPIYHSQHRTGRQRYRAPDRIRRKRDEGGGIPVLNCVVVPAAAEA